MINFFLREHVRTVCFCGIMLFLVPMSTIAQLRIPLWNGKDFDGLRLVLGKSNPDIASPYSIENGVLHFFGGQVGYFRTINAQREYRLHAEWRWPEQNEQGNSGILVHLQLPDSVWPQCVQVQLKAENAGDLIAMNGAFVFEAEGKPKQTALKLSTASEKPEGEWNMCELICRADSLVVYVNDVLQNRGTGLRLTSGYIGFQIEGKPIEFRNLYLIPRPETH